MRQLLDIEAARGGIDDVLVDAAGPIDLVGMPALLHPPLLQGVDVVAVDDLRDGVRDHDHGAVLLDGVDAGLDLLRGDGVQRGRGLVQEDDGRVLEEHPGDGDALLLAAGQVGGLVLEPLRQGHDLVVDVGLARRLHDLLEGGVRLAVADVLLDGAVEDVVLLQDQADVVAQVAGVPFAQVHPVQQDFAALRHIELVQQVHDGALAGARQADQRRDPARLDGHVDAEEGLVAVGIGEIHAAQLELPGHLVRAVAAGGLDLAVGVQDAEEALRIDERVVDVVEDALQLRDRGDDVAEQHHVVHDLSDGHPGILLQHEEGRQDDDQHGADLPHETLESVVVEGHAAGLHLVLRDPVLDVQLLARLDLLAVEALDDVDGVDDVLDALALGLEVRAHLAAPALEAARLAVGDPEIDRHDAQRHEAHIDIGGEHQDQRQQGAREQRQQVDEEILHRARQAAHALVDTGLELAGGVLVRIEIGHPEGQHLLDDALREVARDEDAHPLAVVVLREGDQHREQLLAQQHDADDGQDAGGLRPGEVRADQGVDGIHGAVEHDGVDLRHQGADEGQYKGGQHQPAVGPYKRPDIAEKLDQIHNPEAHLLTADPLPIALFCGATLLLLSVRDRIILKYVRAIRTRGIRGTPMRPGSVNWYYHALTVVAFRGVVLAELLFYGIAAVVLKIRRDIRLRHLTGFLGRRQHHIPGAASAPPRCRRRCWRASGCFFPGRSRRASLVPAAITLAVSVLLFLSACVALFGSRTRHHPEGDGHRAALQPQPPLQGRRRGRDRRPAGGGRSSETARMRIRGGSACFLRTRTASRSPLRRPAQASSRPPTAGKTTACPPASGTLMLREQVFREPGLTLTGLAGRMHTNKTYVSRLVNNTYGMAFPDLLDSLRTEYAKKYILAHPGARQAEIAAASGFSGASAFNSTFKRITGMTPGEWLSASGGKRAC